MSRHQIGVATPLRPLQVATSKRGHDIVSPAHPPSQVATSFFQVATFWSFTYVATSFLCRDLVLAHSGTSRLRHRNPCRDLPSCRPCRDIKSMSRRRFFPTKADQVATSLPGRDLTPNRTRSYPAQPGHDTHFWSRPQAAPQGFLHVATSKSKLQPSQA